MIRRLAVLLLVLAVTVTLALAFRDLARVILAELIRLLWTAQRLVESLPQFVLWALLLVVVVVAAASSLMGGPGRRAGPDPEIIPEPGRVRELSHLIRLAAEGSYSRWTLDHYLTNLAWDVIAHREQISPADAKRRVRAGELELPPAIAGYLQPDTLPRLGPPGGLWSALRGLLRRDRRRAAAQPSLETIVQFLEEQVEVRNVRGPR